MKYAQVGAVLIFSLMEQQENIVLVNYVQSPITYDFGCCQTQWIFFKELISMTRDNSSKNTLFVRCKLQKLKTVQYYLLVYLDIVLFI